MTQSDPLIAPGGVICDAQRLVERGLGVRFAIEYAGERRQAFAVRFQGRVYGYLNSCAHIPIELDYRAGDFFDLSGAYLVCATHGAYYAPESGLCLGGPCPGRSLTPVCLQERDGQVYLAGEPAVFD
ncbi:Rieske 2Fe-2S domain-containing protein [Chitiniphilus purpureus]|uniref:Rieske 2Fe-2S domain-containing protein n=1 Tax=Chitiniphilus purpureus TaxID=2981137 RepID=A0ABY6DKX1_9NEIS|nr:Rieske 2Fe-2S domain-containing protein [Chitiniphilus sp. CD1]UXY14994.1 Rieske 2Fe-2S domain-containing protein [Chitiniphilus sp. CD1]